MAVASAAAAHVKPAAAAVPAVEDDAAPPPPLGDSSAVEGRLMVLKAGKDAAFCEYAYLAPKHLRNNFQEMCADTIDKQAEYWLKSFVKEFEGEGVSQILELAEEFKAYLPEDSNPETATSINAFQAHVFLERRGQTLTVRELRQVMRDICAFNDTTTFSYIEYLAWSYQKTLKELFMVKPYNLEPLLKGLYESMHRYQEDKAQQDAKTEEIEEAIKTHQDSNSIVKGFVAQAALKSVITRGATRRQRDAVFHKYKQQKAQKEYEARKATALSEKKEAERLQRIEAKQRMAARVGNHECKYDKE